MIDDTLFLTGTQRSGSTLLEKLIGAQRGVSMLSQPFPLLFVEAKLAFLRSRGIENDPYPLGHLFRETRYARSDLHDFLHTWRSDRTMLERVFERMRDYSGQYTKFTSDQLQTAFDDATAECDFADVVSRLDHALAQKREARWYGSKETICEEIVPYLLDRGFRCSIIIRDPRDMVASLNSGRGFEFGGSVKPTLNNVRNWRKSVAFALAMEAHPRFHWCRYEDLASRPEPTLSQFGDELGIERMSAGDIETEMAWRGNSSYGDQTGVTTTSIAAYKRTLAPEVAAMIEATCLPEMQLLGYETTLTREEAIRVIARFREPYQITRSGMELDAADEANAEMEARRLHQVTESSAGSEEWFVFEEAQTRLREAFRP